MPEHNPEYWKHYLQAVGKNPAAAAPEAPALFAPMIFAAAGQIEAIEPFEMARDATRLAKCLESARRLLELHSIYTAVPAAAEAQALGADIDAASWPPKVVQGPGDYVLDTDPESLLQGERVAVSIETTQRLAQAGDAVLIAAITGPAALVSQLVQGAAVDDVEDIYEHAGAALVAFVKALGEAGVHAITLQENECPPDEDEENEIWRETLAPIINVAKFHKLPVFMGFIGAGPEASPWPEQIVPCLPAGRHSEYEGLHGCTLSPYPSAWPPRPQGKNLAIVLTQQEVDPNIKPADLNEHIRALLQA